MISAKMATCCNKYLDCYKKRTLGLGGLKPKHTDAVDSFIGRLQILHSKLKSIESMLGYFLAFWYIYLIILKVMKLCLVEKINCPILCAKVFFWFYYFPYIKQIVVYWLIHIFHIISWQVRPKQL